MLYTHILDQLREIYTPRRYSAVIKIIESVDALDETTVLMDQIDNYFNTRTISPESITFEELDLIIANYVVPELVNKLCGILITDFGHDIYFLAGLLEFHTNISKYQIGVTPSIASILDTDELDPISKLGEVINIYQPDYYPLDAHYAVEHIPNEVINKYKKGIEYTMDSISEDTDQIAELYTLMGGINPELLTSELLNYIIRYDAYDISENPALAHILGLVSENRITQTGLAVELAVFAVMFHKDAEDMRDVVMLVYEEFDTSYLLNYIKTTLSAIDEPSYEPI